MFEVDVKTRWHTLPKTHTPTAFSVPNRNIMYLRETKLWRCERRRGGGGRRGENVHLKTHAPLGGRVGKNRRMGRRRTGLGFSLGLKLLHSNEANNYNMQLAIKEVI